MLSAKCVLPGLMVCLTVLSAQCFAEESGAEKKYRSPDRYEKAMLQYEAADKKLAPPKGAIVCVGSSSMRGWHDMIGEDLAPLTLIPRGFGGSNMNELLHYADRIVLPYKPRAIVLYEGDNDIGQGISPQKITSTFRTFVAKVHKDLPECRIYFLSIKPSIKRWKLWPLMTEANQLIAAECEKDKRLTFVDVSSVMLDDEGKPQKALFKADNLHMKREGYLLWREALKPVLIKQEGQHESG